MRRIWALVAWCLVPALLPGLCSHLAYASPSPARDRGAEASAAEEKADASLLQASTFAGLQLRSIGPALTSGRISDIAVHPEDSKIWYVAVASGSVWKTVNAGTTWTPIFDDEGSYSIGCITLDPSNPNIVWVGTGENNSQRSVGYGDGVYKSMDAGRTWQHVGLETSEHIGRIVVHPEDSDTVYVAVQGPLWSAGGDRGLYKTRDGGTTWEAVLEISEHTGINDVLLDPRDPDVLYAAAYQRRRHVWTLINGGPESGIHKSTDGGATWRELTNGLPRVDMGRIGLAMASTDPDVLYAIVEAQDEAGGFFRSTDRGESWQKRSDYVSGSPQYYQELIADPHDVDRVYAVDTLMHLTEDGGTTFTATNYEARHVDAHALWIDPADSDHMLEGNDGGLYETFDRGVTWDYIYNLPVTQFYKIAVDNREPIYHVHGGTQDNFALSGPSRTFDTHGIPNSDWIVTVIGDGFQPRVDPENPDIIYSQSQYGGLVRYDRQSGEFLSIVPQPAPGDDPLRWNWDSPLVLSPHSQTRLYYAAQRIFRSDDRGQSWTPVSPDLTRQLDRNQLEVMGKVWSIDAVSKNRSTSPYGNIVALAESPRVEGLLYAGTDDGLVQVSRDGGATWAEFNTFPGVPEGTYVNRLEPSSHEDGVVFAAFNNHKRGDFKPYLLISRDYGATWTSMAGDLPERGSVYAVVQDPVRPELLFAGTEFGAYFTVDGGSRWIELTGGVPTIAVRDLAIQEREVDLVLGTFGRGFYILDDYTPLRKISADTLEQEAMLFPVKPVRLYNPSAPVGLAGAGFRGHSYYLGENPPHGAVFTYYLKEAPKTRRDARREREKEIEEEGGTVSYPSWDDLSAELREEDPRLLFTIRDADGEVVRRLTAPASAGVQRVTWDLRYPNSRPTRLAAFDPGWWSSPHIGPMVVPGTYSVDVQLWADDALRPLAGPESFSAEPLGNVTLETADRDALLDFQRQTARLQRAVLGSVRAANAAAERLTYVRRAALETPTAGPDLEHRARALEHRLQDLMVELVGDPVRPRFQELAPPAITQRVGEIVDGHWTSSADPTGTHRENYRIAAEAFADLLPDLRQLIDVDLVALEAELEAVGAPWTPGRSLPRWSPDGDVSEGME